MSAGVTLRAAPWAAPYFLAAALALVVGILTWARGRGELRRPLLVLEGALAAALLAAGAARLAADARTGVWTLRLAAAVSVWVAPAAVSFAQVVGARSIRRVRQLATVGAISSTVLSLCTPWVIAAARPGRWGLDGVSGPLHPLLPATLALTLSLPVLLSLRLRDERRVRARRQLTVLLVAALVSLLAAVDALSPLGLDAPPLGWAPLAAAIVLLPFAALRYRLLDVRLAVWRALGWLVPTLLGALPFLALTLPLAPRFAGASAVRLAAFFGALVLVMRAYLVTVQPRVDALTGRRRRDLAGALAWLIDEAARLQTTEEIGLAVDGFLGALGRRLAALVIIDRTGRPRVALSSRGSIPAPSRGSPLLHELARLRAPLCRDHARGPARLQIERACLRWGAEYLAPLVDGEELIGFLAITPREDGDLADMVEVEALDRLSVVVTTALAAARLYERLHTLSGELEQKAQARSRSLARAVDDLRGAEARLLQSEKLATLGQIVAGVAADLGAQVEDVHVQASRVRQGVALLVRAADEARVHASFEGALHDVARDIGPLLDAVGEGARRAHGIASDLQRLAPLDPEGPSLQRPRGEDASLAQLIDSTLTLLAGQLLDVEVVRRYAPELPPVPIETGPMGQVILNLALNAAQAMKGRGRLTVSTARRAQEIELAVADTGPGIPPETLPHIFEPFFSTKQTMGTGLGLSISHSIVERHGGRMTVETAAGVGTTFRVLLPLGRKSLD